MSSAVLRGGGGNLGVILVRVCGQVSIIYLAFEKYDLFIYLIVHNVDVHVFICCPLILYRGGGGTWG